MRLQALSPVWKNYAETESAEEAKSDQVEALKRGQPKIELYYLILYVM